MGTDAPPTDCGLTFDFGPLPGGAAIGVVHAPGELPDLIGALNPLYPEAFRPKIAFALRGPLGGVVELREGFLPELLLVLLGQGPIVAIKLRGRFELQRDSKASRWARKSSAES